MAEFQLDTSGVVRVLEDDTGGVKTYVLYTWRDLNPFQQGYAGALLSGPIMGRFAPLNGRFGFADLASETIKAILQDCAAFAKMHPPAEWEARMACSFGPEWGRYFWRDRQNGNFPTLFPPLTAYLGDDGKIHLRETK